MTQESLPTGTVTFLFTDIEGSTTLWERHGEAMRPALARHDALLRAAVAAHAGRVVKTTGDGLHAVFAAAGDALAATLRAQRDLAAADWAAIAPDTIRVRMGLHTGEAELRDGDYYGAHVNRAARIMSVGHGGQILLSGISRELVYDGLPLPLELRDLGEHALRGLTRPEQLWQLVAPDLRDSFPPLRTSALFVGNLPARLTSFVGRAREMAQVRELLRQARLLTLTGPGGTGKTRLSLQVAADVQPEYEHGAWWVELAPLTEAAEVIATIALTFGLAPGPGGSNESNLTDYLREKHLLLILDNCEHLIEPVARLVAALLPECPRLTILASSREGLGVYGETTFHLSTLTLPAAETTNVAEAQLSEAVQLFVERAAAVRPGFALTGATAAPVVQIVRRLDGIPLAIELAAARVSVFGVEQIAARLDDRFRLLTGGSRTALPRQQTLRALIDWGYDLLDDDERTLLRQLSVFMGGWSFAAAEFMAGELDVFALLPALVNKSLVVVVEAPLDAWGETEDAPEPRYAYLETIRQYARDRLLEAGEMEAARDSHFAYFEALSRTAANFVALSRTIDVDSERLRYERDNLAAAVAWGLERYPDRVLEICWNLSVFLADQNPGGDGVRWVRAALSELDKLPPPASPEDEARRNRVRQRGKATLAMFSLFLGELLVARSITGPLIEELRATDGDRLLLGIALFSYAQAAYFLEDPRAGEVAAEAVAVIRSLEDSLSRDAAFLAVALLVMAESKLAAGDEVAATAAMDEAERLLAGSTSYYLPWAEFVRARLWRSRGAGLDELRRQMETSLARLRASRSYRVAAMMESDMAHRLRAEDQLEEAVAIYRRTLPQWQQLGHRAAVANQLECLAFICRVWKQPQHAARLFGAAEHIREVAGQPMLGQEQSVYDEEVAALRDMLPPDEFRHLWLEGRAMSTDAAVNYALRELPAHP